MGIHRFQEEHWKDRRVVALSGGIGGARLVQGLAEVLPPGRLTVIANTGDDFEHLGLWISPDCDTLMYTLAQVAPEERGWGIDNDSHAAMHQALKLGAPDWFQLGDQDIGTNLLRTARMRKGDTLTTITADFVKAYGLSTHILPMSDTPHPTVILDKDGQRHSFQDWLVKYRGAPVVRQIQLRGDKQPTNDVIQALEDADLIVFPPSNPFVSLDPILRLHGVRERVAAKPVVGVSPIIHGAAVKGPLATMIPALLQEEASAGAIARYYHSLLDAFVVAPGDRDKRSALPQLETDILLPHADARRRLAAEVLHWADTLLLSPQP